MKYSSSRVHHISGEEKGEVVYTSSRRKESLLSGAERPLQVRLRCHLPKLDSTPALQLLKRRKPSCQSSRYKQEQTKEHAVWCAQHGTARHAHHMPVTGNQTSRAIGCVDPTKRPFHAGSSSFRRPGLASIEISLVSEFLSSKRKIRR